MIELETPRPALRLVTPASGRDRAGIWFLDHRAGQRATRGEASIRVLVAADHALDRAGYHALLENEDRIAVVGEVASADEAIALAVETRPDVVLLDLAVAGVDDVQATARTVSHPAFAGVAVLVMAWSECDERALTALRGGAAGVLTKDAAPAELIRAMHLVAAGTAVISLDTMRGLLEDLPLRSTGSGSVPEELAELTDREREIVALVAAGLSNGEIAELLVISPATAKTHVSRAMVKVGARHRAQLVTLAYESGLVRPHTRPTRRRASGQRE